MTKNVNHQGDPSPRPTPRIITPASMHEVDGFYQELAAIFEPRLSEIQDDLDKTYSAVPEIDLKAPPLSLVTPVHEKQRQLQHYLDLPLGTRLLTAGLLTQGHIEVVLRDQEMRPDLLFGEILKLRNWVRDETLEFFLDLEFTDSQEFQELRLGQRLKLAGLVSQDEIMRALRRQHESTLRLGRILSRLGVLNSKTADFFARL